ncbi:Cyclopropane-fatty-acyl-phospholipid synthase [Gossypium australe]|uniref:Cyclopropane-fatty-acyl-phospholipid synthase n=1 Tax=Gossypium australe TaxID=47621 RepID=A0A5B6V4A7_9ROSI|nr:Cyclopropane-fatty-acyl-phospholipid synthase [Gossypium australe]
MVWDSLCTPKGIGGIGFRNLRLFNITLLGRQVWRLINNNDNLCYRVLCSKYFSDGDVLHLKVVDKPCFSWMSIVDAVKALETGFGWQIGDGRTTRYGSDR